MTQTAEAPTFEAPTPPDISSAQESTNSVDASLSSAPVADAAAPEVPSIPDVPGVAEEERERKPRLPRLTPPATGWKEFPVPEFDDTKYSAPTKKDFDQTGPYYEQYRLAKIDEDMEGLRRTRKEVEEEIDLWKECGNDAERVELRRKEVRMKNATMSFISEGKLSKEDFAQLMEAARKQGLV